MTLEVFKDVLIDSDFKKIKNFYDDLDTPWYFQPEMIPGSDNDDRGFFGHYVFLNNRITSPSYELLLPLLEKLNVGPLINIRTNLVVRSDKPYECVFHNDCVYEQAKTAIFYLTTNNGYTEFNNEEKTKIYCEENKLVLFDCKLQHKMVSQTNSNKRLLVNINFFPK